MRLTAKAGTFAGNTTTGFAGLEATTEAVTD